MRKKVTHDGFLSTTVIGLLHEEQIEIIEVELSLKRELVIRVKNVKGEHSSRSLEGCRVPPYTQKLGVLLNPLSVLRACAELYVDTMSSIEVDDKDLSSGGRRRTDGILVTNVVA